METCFAQIGGRIIAPKAAKWSCPIAHELSVPLAERLGQKYHCDILSFRPESPYLYISPFKKLVLRYSPPDMSPIPALANHIYVIDAPFAPWLWPALAIAGIYMQLAGVATRQLWPIYAGFILIIPGCCIENDLALFIGDIIACAAASIWHFKSRHH